MMALVPCSPNQYQYQFKKWDIKKSMTTEQKDAVVSALGKRKRNGKSSGSTADFTIAEAGFKKEVDKRNLKRYLRKRLTGIPDMSPSVSV